MCCSNTREYKPTLGRAPQTRSHTLEGNRLFLSQQLRSVNSLWATVCSGVTLPTPCRDAIRDSGSCRSSVCCHLAMSPHVQLSCCTWKTYFPKVIYHLWLLQWFLLPFLQWSLSLGREGSDRYVTQGWVLQSPVLWVSVLPHTARSWLTCWVLRETLICGIKINHQGSLSFNTMPIYQNNTNKLPTGAHDLSSHRSLNQITGPSMDSISLIRP